MYSHACDIYVIYVAVDQGINVEGELRHGASLLAACGEGIQGWDSLVLIVEGVDLRFIQKVSQVIKAGHFHWPEWAMVFGGSHGVGTAEGHYLSLVEALALCPHPQFPLLAFSDLLSVQLML